MVSTQDKDKDKYEDRDGDEYKDRHNNKHRVNSAFKIVRLNKNQESFILHSNDCNDQGFNTSQTQRNYFFNQKQEFWSLKSQLNSFSIFKINFELKSRKQTKLKVIFEKNSRGGDTSYFFN